jgi:phage-related protein
MSAQVLRDLLGKRVSGVVVVQQNQAGARNQLYLVFDGDTNFEIFGDTLGWSSHIYPGGMKRVVEVARKAGGAVTVIGEGE